MYMQTKHICVYIYLYMTNFSAIRVLCWGNFMHLQFGNRCLTPGARTNVPGLQSPPLLTGLPPPGLPLYSGGLRPRTPLP